MPTDIATVRHLSPKPVSWATKFWATKFWATKSWAPKVFGVPIMIWALALLLVGAIAHLNPPIAAPDALEVIGTI